MFSDGGEVCVGADCAHRNCSWTEWGEWSSCSRSCGVGQQQRIRTFLSPGASGSWCEDILGGNLEHRFCNIRPCRGQLAHQHVESIWKSGFSIQPAHCNGYRIMTPFAFPWKPQFHDTVLCVSQEDEG